MNPIRMATNSGVCEPFVTAPFVGVASAESGASNPNEYLPHSQSVEEDSFDRGGCPQSSFRVASYNIENLFDSIDDPNKRDETTLAKSPEDMQKLAAALLAADADVVSLQEVENIEILNEFLDKYLPGVYTNRVLVEGNDMRGIDVAVISKHPITGVTTHKDDAIPLPDGSGKTTRFRRDFLRVDLQVGQYPFSVYSTHLKAQAGGKRADDVRMAEASAARRIVEEDMRAFPGRRFVVTGDFNDTPNSDVGRVFLGDENEPSAEIPSVASDMTFAKTPSGMPATVGTDTSPTVGTGTLPAPLLGTLPAGNSGAVASGSLPVAPSSGPEVAGHVADSSAQPSSVSGPRSRLLNSALADVPSDARITHPVTGRCIDYIMYPEHMQQEFVGGGIQQIEREKRGSDHLLIYADFLFA